MPRCLAGTDVPSSNDASTSQKGSSSVAAMAASQAAGPPAVIMTVNCWSEREQGHCGILDRWRTTRGLTRENAKAAQTTTADITLASFSRRNRSARHSQIPFATPCRADDVTSMHHTRFFRTYVMASTTNQTGCRILPVAVETEGD